MDFVQQSLNAIRQKAQQITNRASSNLNWAGNQIQQNVVSPIQQAPAKVFSPQNVNAFQKGFSAIPNAVQNQVIKPIQVQAQKEGLALSSLRQQEINNGLQPSTLINAASPIGRIASAIRTDYAPEIDKFLSGQNTNPVINRITSNTALLTKPLINTVSDVFVPKITPEEQQVIRKINRGEILTPAEINMAKVMSSRQQMMMAGMTSPLKGNMKPFTSVSNDSLANIESTASTEVKTLANKLKIKPGESFGDFQKRLEASSRPLLTKFNDLVSKQNYEKASNILEQMKGQEAYKDYIKPLGNILDESFVNKSAEKLSNIMQVRTDKAVETRMTENVNKLLDITLKKTTERERNIQKMADSVEKSTGVFVDKKITKNLNKLMDIVLSETEKIGKARIKAEKNMQAGLPPEGAPIGPIRKNNILTSLSDEMIRRSKYVVQKMGISGKELSKRVDAVYQNAEIKAGNLVADLKNAYQGLNKQNIENINRFLDGQDVQLTPQEIQVSQKIRTMLDSVVTEGQQKGLQELLPDGNIVPLQKRENYFPQIIDLKKLEQYKQVVIDHLISTKQFPDQNAAKAFVEDMINGSPIYEAYKRYATNVPARRFGNLEFARTLDLPTIVRRYDPDVIAEYFSRASHRLEEVSQFGVNNEQLNTLLDGVAREGYDYQKARTIVERALGVASDNTAVRQAVGKLKQIQSLTKLGLGAITNIGQTTNTFASAGFKNTFGAIKDSFTPQGKEYAERAGVVLTDTLQQFSEEALGKGPLTKITAPGFRRVERFNRIVAANAGKRLVIEMVDRLKTNPNDKEATKILQKLIGNVNIEQILSEGFTPEQLQRAGNNMSNITQFRVRSWDMPMAFNNPYVSLAMQFKSFAYNHADFMAKEVIAPIKNGNFAPLIRFTIAGMILGELLQDTKAMLRFRDRPEDLRERLADNITSVGGLGIAGDIVNAASRGPEAVMKWIAGPTLSDIGDIAGGIGLAAQGKPKTIARFGIRQIPIVGPSAANLAFPPQGSYKARTPDLIQEGIGIQPTGETKGTETLSTDPVIRAEQISQIQGDLTQKKKELLDGAGINIFGKQLIGLTEQEKSQKIAEINQQKELLSQEKKIKEIQAMQESTEPLRKYKEIESIKYANTVLNNDKLSNDSKTQIIQSIGLDYKKALYYNTASMPEEVRYMMIQDEIQKLLNQGKESQVLEYLLTQRTPVAGKMMLNDALLTKLTNDGIITRSERDVIKKQATGAIGSKYAKISTQKPKMTKISIPRLKKVRAAKATKLKAVKLPKLKPLKAQSIKRVKAK